MVIGSMEGEGVKVMDKALREMGFARDEISKVKTLLADTPEHNRGILLLALVVGRGHGDGAVAFKMLAEHIVNI